MIQLALAKRILSALALAAGLFLNACSTGDSQSSGVGGGYFGTGGGDSGNAPDTQTGADAAGSVDGFVADGAGADGSALALSPGWHPLPNTKLEDVCACTHGFPDVCGIESCSGIVDDWNGAILDTSRNRLVI